MQKDEWAFLQQFTAARIARGRAGHSLPTAALLRFQTDHAQARDAVYSGLAIEALKYQIDKYLSLPVFQLNSQANTRSQYLQRPDLGRTLSQESRQMLTTHQETANDICFVITDGLSADAVNQHALPLLRILVPMLHQKSWKIAPICLVQQGRVAVADEIGVLLKSKIVLILLGERPGLSSPDSMGAYITYQPQLLLTDERRNCVSNIRPEGMDFQWAANKISYLLQEMTLKKLSGVNLKDQMDEHLLA